MQVKGLYSAQGCFHATIQCLLLSENSFLRLNVTFRLRSNVTRIVNVNVCAKQHNFNIPQSLDNYNVIIILQNLKFMKEFTSTINVEYLHSSLQAKLLMHNCARAKHAKTYFRSI